MLTGKNIIVYDLEIKKTIEQCSRGWASLDEMGISVGCLYDYRDDSNHVYMDDNIGQLINRLSENGTWIVAFNHIQFDNALLRATIRDPRKTLPEDSQLKNYDMLIESRKAAGAVGRIPGFKLDDHLEALRLPLKTANGAMAPIMYQQGKIGELIDYCLNDVRQERRLFEHIILNRALANKAFPEGFSITLPEELNQIINAA